MLLKPSRTPGLLAKPLDSESGGVLSSVTLEIQRRTEYHTLPRELQGPGKRREDVTVVVQRRQGRRVPTRTGKEPGPLLSAALPLPPPRSGADEKQVLVGPGRRGWDDVR